jgi:hypothetical protein
MYLAQRLPRSHHRQPQPPPELVPPQRRRVPQLHRHRVHLHHDRRDAEGDLQAAQYPPRAWRCWCVEEDCGERQRDGHGLLHPEERYRQQVAWFDADCGMYWLF